MKSDFDDWQVSRILTEIARERRRQDKKWGEQNHPMLNVPYTADAMMSSSKVYRRLNDLGENSSWFQILMEEVYEVFAETEPEKQREEMVQVAAVAVQIIEYLDRRIEERA
jgi:hypothetical protein